MMDEALTVALDDSNTNRAAVIGDRESDLKFAVFIALLVWENVIQKSKLDGRFSGVVRRTVRAEFSIDVRAVVAEKQKAFASAKQREGFSKKIFDFERINRSSCLAVFIVEQAACKSPREQIFKDSY